MRATATPSSIRKGKGRLLESCAIAAGLIALAFGGPALAQVAGTGNVVSGGATISPPASDAPTNVFTSGSEAIIDWTPSNAPVGGVVDFLPAGNTLNFFGTGDYVVLNRFVSGTGTPISDQIALNGTVNGFNSSSPGGNIWFYNAGGILIGSSGVINVGSLVLSANAIDTSGGLMPGGTIRFRGPTSTSAITVNGAINATNSFNPGSSYVALVAPRVVQAGNVRVDGSAAYVAAEQADIRINSGMFDINVTVGAEGGNIITHTGSTTGPAHQQGDADQSRIYMVAIPKNDAVTMLVSGAIGYDDALSAQTDPDGAVRLSAGYNITAGEQNATPVNATAANIIVNDTLFRSSTVALASGTFAGEALQQIPTSPPPLSSAGRIFVEGDGVFSGDAGASLTIGTGQQGGAAGNLTVRSNGTVGTAGNVAVNVSGGTLSTGNLLQITSLSLPAAATGDSIGGTASLTITGGTVTTPVIALSASAVAEIGTNGLAGNARGGNASISVSNAGTVLDTDAVTISASAFGPTNISVATGGDAQGGTATLAVSNGASFRATNSVSSVSIDANGSGGFGPVQSGSGTGGTARIEISGANTSFESLNTSIVAQGSGGGSFGPNEAQNGGDGTGGRAELVIDAEDSATASLGILSLDASGRGGDASNSGNVTGGNGQGGIVTIDVQGGTLDAGAIDLSANGIGGISGRGFGQGGTATFTQTGGTVSISDMTVSADGTGGVGVAQSGDGIGGTATVNLLGGTMSAADITATADGFGAAGLPADDMNPSSPPAGGRGGNGRGGNATINIDGSATVDASVIGAYARAQGGDGGNFSSFSFPPAPGDPGDGGNGNGGNATINLRTGAVLASSMVANASGTGGNGGNVFGSSSSGTATGVGTGGAGGNGQGGTATISLASAVGSGGTLRSISRGVGGDGGSNNVGGDGGDGLGGIAQAIVNNFDAGALAVTLDAGALGGAGADGRDGNGGNGGSAVGGTARAAADGTNANVTMEQVQFITDSVGGAGGRGGLAFFANPAATPMGGLGGDGRGGTVEIGAANGATVTLTPDSSGIILLSSSGTGGTGGDGASNDAPGGTGGTGGNGGVGQGGAVVLRANGGTITSNASAVDIMVSGVSGAGGGGGGGATVPGTGGNTGTTTGGRAVIEASAGTNGPGQISLGGTNINASGDNAGRIELRAGGNITMASLNAMATGTASPTNNDTDVATTGIFLAATGGTIATTANMALTTDGSIGVHALGGGAVSVGTGLAMNAADQVDIRHDQRGGTAPTIRANDEMSIIAGTSISGASGSLIGSGSTLSLVATGPNGTIGVDRLDAANIVINSAGAASVEHAETSGDFTASAGSFRTGLNSIITGGDIIVNSPGAVDLGNSTAGGFVSVDGQSIAFNSIGAGGSVFLTASGTVPGAEGITGNIIASGGDVLLRSAGNVTVATSVAANGGWTNPNGVTAEGNLFVDAAGNALLTGASAARMVGVNAGQAAAITGGSAGEDLLILAGTTANLANFTAGDDVEIRAPGAIVAQTVSTTGLGPDTRAMSYLPGSGFTIGTATATDGADIILTSANGAINATGLSAGDDILLTAATTATVNGATTLGLGATGGDSSIRIQGGDATLGDLNAFDHIVVTSPGAVDLGNATAGGFVSVDGQSIVFNTIIANGSVSMLATGTAAGAEGINGNIITSGGNVTLNAAGNITIADSVTAAGGWVAPNGVATAGDLFVDAAGNVMLTDATARRMAGIRAGQAVSLSGGSTQEDLLVIAGTTATLTNYATSDDITIQAGGGISAQNISTTGTGTDTLSIDYLPGSGFSVATSAANGADIVLASNGGAVTANNLAAADDILLTAATTVVVNGATTLGLGITGGDSSIRTQGGDITLGNLDAFDDIVAVSTGAVAITAPATAGRDISIDAVSVNVATLNNPNPGGGLIDALDAGRNLQVTASGAISGGAVRAGGNLELISGTTIAVGRATTGIGGSLTLDGASGVTAGIVASGGTTSLNSTGGAVAIDSLASSGVIDASGQSVLISGGSSGNLLFSQINATTGDASITNGGDIALTGGAIAGRAALTSTNGAISVQQLTANSIDLAAQTDMTLGGVTATQGLNARTGNMLTLAGVATGSAISLTSGDIVIGASGRAGTAGTTQALRIANGSSGGQTFIGGTGTRSGYHLDADEMARLYGVDIEISGPAAGGGSGNPDIVIDSFTMTGGNSGSNLGTNGSLTITTPGQARVIGNVQLTGLTDDNVLNLAADDRLEVVMGQGSVRLSGANTAPAGQLNMTAGRVIVATLAAIADTDAATTTDAIETRLAQNDGVTSDEGALFARGIRADVDNGFYVQNSGTGTAFAERRGLTFGAGGLDIVTDGPSRIVINGVQLGATGQVTGFDTLAFLTIGGGPVSSAQGRYDPRSRLNGCFIAATGACTMLPGGSETSFPVQDVVDDPADPDAEEAEGNNLPTPLITMRDIDPLTGEPLLDDPVTGAGNDDLWTPPAE